MSVITYKCPNCGGSLKFDADSQNWKCEYCLSSFSKAELDALESKMNIDEDAPEENILFDIGQKELDEEFERAAKVYCCNSCGAEIITDETTAATFCYYCHNPAIIPGKLTGSFRPSKVLPFKIKRDGAREAFIKWCKKKPLLSKKFISDSQLEKLTGVYIPFWLYDCDIRGYMAADARNVRTWTSGNKRYTETKYYNVVRSGEASFNGIPADGSKKTDDKLMETLEPFDYSMMEDFSMSYLSGYMAEKYDVDKEQVFGRVSDRIRSYSNSLLRDTISGYDSVTVKNSNIDIYNSKAAYVLLPTWMFTYKYNNKTYVFAMNGQTGKIAGSLPISKARAAAWFGIVSGSIFAVLLVGGMLLW